MKKCKHQMGYWENQYGVGDSVYVIRKCRLCGIMEKGKIGKFKECTKKEKEQWSSLHSYN